MFLYNTTSDEVNKVTDKMVCKSSCGVDKINSKVIKYVAQYRSMPSSHIFNLTFETGKIPDDLKVALVTPVYKSSEKMFIQIIDQFPSFRVFLKSLKS